MLSMSFQEKFEQNLAVIVQTYDKKGVDRQFIVGFVNEILKIQYPYVSSTCKFHLIGDRIFNINPEADRWTNRQLYCADHDGRIQVFTVIEYNADEHWVRIKAYDGYETVTYLDSDMTPIDANFYYNPDDGLSWERV